MSNPSTPRRERCPRAGRPDVAPSSHAVDTDPAFLEAAGDHARTEAYLAAWSGGGTARC